MIALFKNTNIPKAAAPLLALVLCLLSQNISPTGAFFSDKKTTSGEISTGRIEFSLEEDAGVVTITNTGTAPFIYSVKTSLAADKNLVCDESSIKLNGEDFWSPREFGPIPVGSSEELVIKSAEDCAIELTYQAWQENLEYGKGFYATAIDTFELKGDDSNGGVGGDDNIKNTTQSKNDDSRCAVIPTPEAENVCNEPGGSIMNQAFEKKESFGGISSPVQSGKSEAAPLGVEAVLPRSEEEPFGAEANVISEEEEGNLDKGPVVEQSPLNDEEQITDESSEDTVREEDDTLAGNGS